MNFLKQIKDNLDLAVVLIAIAFLLSLYLVLNYITEGKS